MAKTKVAIIGSGNIGTDLMIKVMRLSDVLEMGVMVGIDPGSDGLARAARMGVATTHKGIDGLLDMPEFQDVEIVFDATSAGAHKRNSELVLAAGKRMIDLTPAAIGPYVIPPVNGDTCLDAKNVNMVTSAVRRQSRLSRRSTVSPGCIMARSSLRSLQRAQAPARVPISTSSQRRPAKQSWTSAEPPVARRS